MITAEKIITIVSDYFHVPEEVILSKCSREAIVAPRHVSIYLIYHNTDLSFARIGTLFNYKDHSGVTYACKQVNRSRKYYSEYRDMLEMFEDEIKSLNVERNFEVFQESDFYK